MVVVKYSIKPIPARGMAVEKGTDGVDSIELYKNVCIARKERETIRIDQSSGYYSVTAFDGEKLPEEQLEARRKRFNKPKGGQ